MNVPSPVEAARRQVVILIDAWQRRWGAVKQRGGNSIRIHGFSRNAKVSSGSVCENGHGRPRVLQVITKLDMGGAEVVALDLVAALHGTIDFAVATVLDVEPTPVGKAMRAQLADLAIPVFPGSLGHYKKGGAIVAAWRLARAVLRFQPDLVHLHTEMPELTWSIAQVLFPWIRRVPVLRTVHNSELWIAWDGIGRWVTNRLASARAVAVSQAAAAADAEIATRRARPVAKVIYNGVRAPSGVLGALETRLNKQAMVPA